eukprot:TRINITY_DN7602_c0_g1_i1.p1 TRINITY_DN7602_c0_g1~~TRINITY_DN7602_c0_g1_i1.p1  ORF type:complete len:534 (+),score=120.41 TRINITY_DN7602_c0_g1_i1:1386-2987(+)
MKNSDELEYRSDKDLNRKFFLGNLRETLFRQLEKDLEFLRNYNVHMYSMVIGIHHATSTATPPYLFKQMNAVESSKFRRYYGGCASGDEVYFIGIVDFLTIDGVPKRGSVATMKLSSSLSNTRKDPQSYYQRFLTYLMEVFPMEGPPPMLPVTPISPYSVAPNPSSPQTNSSTRPMSGLAQVVCGIRRVAELSGLETYRKATIEEEDFKTHGYHDVTGTNGVVFPVKEYAPYVFKALRDLSGIDTKTFISSWALSEENLIAKEGAGRSGSLFCFSEDKKFIFKTISHKEIITLLNFLPNYYQHFKNHPSTLIMKFLGVYRFMKPTKLYVIVIGNILYSPLSVDIIYDLKGRQPKPGKYGRNKEGSGKVLKDNDLERQFYLGSKLNAFLEQMELDVNLLKTNNLMDYSLLVGVHKIDELQSVPNGDMRRDGGSTSIFSDYNGGFLSHPAQREVYYIGIIDCLTFYGKTKRIANFSKSFLWEPVQLSTVEAEFYADRFCHFFKELMKGAPDVVVPTQTEENQLRREQLLEESKYL